MTFPVIYLRFYLQPCSCPDLIGYIVMIALSTVPTQSVWIIYTALMYEQMWLSLVDDGRVCLHAAGTPSPLTADLPIMTSF